MGEGSSLDRRFMAAAIRLGASALGTTWPNPAVGAIVVKDGIVLGRGRTGTGGRPHGEPIALAQAGAEARGATLYASLEPCAHYGRTPPCTDAIVASGIARVVASTTDPDPRVAGKGLERLRAADIAAVADILPAEAKRMQCGHIRRITENRPYVLLKLAVSADEAIGRRGEPRVQVTGVVARRHAQALRSRADAILVGRGTVEADDPALTCRLPGLEARSPVRVVLDSEGRIGADRNVFGGAAPPWVFTAAHEDDNGPARRMRVPRHPGGLELAAVLSRLASEGITRLLVEGGAKIARAFLEADLVDEVMLFRSPVVLGGDIVSALAGLPLAFIEEGGRFRRTERRMFGPDRMSRYERAG